MINTKNYSLSDGEAGILLTFPSVPQSLPQKNVYIIDFKVSSRLPTLSPPTIKFTPDNPSYTITGNKNFAPTVTLKIKANHNFETQSLIQAIVKDQYNNIIYTDYILVICSPKSEFKFNGSLLNRSVADGLGPNGGTVLRLNSVESIKDLSLGMRVTGPGITGNSVVPSTAVTIRSFISNTSTDIELSTDLNIGSSTVGGSYSFVRTISCASPEQLTNKQYQNTYVVLDKSNNWTFSYDEQLIAKFVRVDNNQDDVKILLPIKNVSVLVEKDSSASLPQTTDIYLNGRINNDSVCVGTI